MRLPTYQPQINTLGIAFAAARTARQQPLIEVALAADLAKTTIERLEAGEAHAARLDTMLTVAHTIEYTLQLTMSQPGRTPVIHWTSTPLVSVEDNHANLGAQLKALRRETLLLGLREAHRVTAVNRGTIERMEAGNGSYVLTTLLDYVQQLGLSVSLNLVPTRMRRVVELSAELIEV